MRYPNEGKKDYDRFNCGHQPGASSNERRPTRALRPTERHVLSPPLAAETPGAESVSAAGNEPESASSPVSRSLGSVREPCGTYRHDGDKPQAASDAGNVIDVTSERSRTAPPVPMNGAAETSNRFADYQNDLGDQRSGAVMTMHRLLASLRATGPVLESPVANAGDGRKHSDAPNYSRPSTSSTSGTAYDVAADGSARSPSDGGRSAHVDSQLSLYNEDRCLCLRCAPSCERIWHTTSFQRPPWSDMYDLNFWGFLVLVYVLFIGLLITGLRAVMSKWSQPVGDRLDTPSSKPTTSTMEDAADHEDHPLINPSPRGTTGALGGVKGTDDWEDGKPCVNS